jgi:hypothetical protein
MRKFLTAIAMSACLGVFAQDQDLAFLHMSKFYNDSVYHPSLAGLPSAAIVKTDFAHFNLSSILYEKKAVKKTLGYTKKNKPIEVYYFPGTSRKKALVIGGVHGSELSSVEVAKNLVSQLSKGAKPYYSVIIIPSLFPDNAATAETCKRDRVINNVGRYSYEEAIDPNRQLPSLGTPFYIDEAKDAYGRKIEKENQLLLQLIQAYVPERIINLHAIKDYGKAGIYADPRTDCEGRALGYSSDSTLAVLMAKYIDAKGGNVAGNKIKTSPTALYYLDPKPAPVGEKQERNLTGANLKGKISGVSLGSWASTAVCDEANNYSRPAMRILTMEFPGYKKSSEYKFEDDKRWYSGLMTLYASSIYNYFLQEYCVEENDAEEKSLALN